MRARTASASRVIIAKTVRAPKVLNSSWANLTETVLYVYMEMEGSREIEEPQSCPPPWRIHQNVVAPPPKSYDFHVMPPYTLLLNEGLMATVVKGHAPACNHFIAQLHAQ